MNRRKRVTRLLIVLLLVTVFTGCGKEDGTDDVAVSKDPIVIKVGYENNPGDPIDEGVKKWATLLAERSDGTMTMELYPAGKLATRDDLLDRMTGSKTEAVMTLADSAYLAEKGVADMGILYGPYLFDTWDDVWKLQESDWWTTQQSNLEKEGLKMVVSNWNYGDRHLLTTKPVHKVEDLKGLKLRVPDNEVQKRSVELLGAEPVTLALGEVSANFKDQSVDGLENPLTVLYDGGFHEDANYLLMDGHVKNFTNWICSSDFFNGLSKEQQSWLVDTGKEAGVYTNELQQQGEKDALAKLKAEGVTVTELTSDQRAAFKEASKGFYTDEQMTKGWSVNLYETIDGIIGK